MDNGKEWSAEGWWSIFILSVFLGGIFTLSIMGYPRGDRKLAKRAACASNLGSICKAIVVYRGESEDVWPAELSVLTRRGFVSTKAFVCPATSPGDYANSPSPATCPTADEILTHSSYVYVPFADDCPGDICCLFELPINNDGEGFNMATANISIMWRGGSDAFLIDVQNLNNYLCSRRGGVK